MRRIIIIIFASFFSISCSAQENGADLRKKAEELAHEFLIIDTHIDLPYQLKKKYYDVTDEKEEGQFNYHRSIKGGLNSAFMSIYIPYRLEDGGAKEHADTLISFVKEIAEKNPDKFAVITSPGEAKKYFGKKVITLPMGMENGSPIEGDLENLKYFYEQGIRYITLCHVKDNHICDSSGDETEDKWNGLSPFGEKVVREMNRLGIMVDISHVSDSTFFDVLQITEVPVIASHSGCRFFTPGYERNMSDEMIKALADNGGVIQIYFGSTLLDNDVRLAYEERGKKRDEYFKANDHATREEFNEKFPIKNADIKDVVKHIDHVVKLVGIDHVGFGSDFDGVSILPEKIADVSMYPNLIYELLKLGYSEEDIRKICAENLLRVWKEAEAYAEAN